MGDEIMDVTVAVLFIAMLGLAFIVLALVLAVDVRNPQVDKESAQGVVVVPSLIVFGCGSMVIRAVLRTRLTTTLLTTVHLTMM
jgi:hypothetical protein